MVERGCRAGPWEAWLEEAVEGLERSMLLRSLRPLKVAGIAHSDSQICKSVLSASQGCAGTVSEHLQGLGPAGIEGVQNFEGLGPWDRSAVEVEVSHPTFLCWIKDSASTGEDVCDVDSVLEHASDRSAEVSHKLLLFSGNDYLGLSVHPAVRCAAAKAALEFGMGPRASALVCGYTHYHRLLESALADLKQTEDCLLCPSGFAANMAVMTALASVAPNRVQGQESVMAIFSDSLNHASIIDGVRIAQKQGNSEVHVYKHNDMAHLNLLLSNCKQERKVVVTDSLFSMDGDFAPVMELVGLRRKHGFLLVIDEAHGTLVCGENGGGVAEAFGVQNEIDIHVGTLSKAVGCHGGFIASSKKWKQLIQSRGRSFIFSTSLPIPVVAAAHAAILVAQKERWRQQALWERVQQFSKATGLHFSSPIAPIILGSADDTLAASRQLLTAGFHVSAIRPPTVPLNSSRLRITLSAAHTAADVDALVAALPPWIKSRSSSFNSLYTTARWLPSSLPENTYKKFSKKSTADALEQSTYLVQSKQPLSDRIEVGSLALRPKL